MIYSEIKLKQILSYILVYTTTSIITLNYYRTLFSYLFDILTFNVIVLYHISLHDIQTRTNGVHMFVYDIVANRFLVVEPRGRIVGEVGPWKGRPRCMVAMVTISI